MSTHAAAATEADLEPIRQLVANAVEYQSEVEPLMELHTEQTIVVNFAGRRVLGREAFRDAMRRALDSPLAQVFTSVEINDVQFVSSDVAIVSCTKTIRDQRDDSERPAVPAVGAMSYVVVKHADAWRIALAQTTPIGN